MTVVQHQFDLTATVDERHNAGTASADLKTQSAGNAAIDASSTADQHHTDQTTTADQRDTNATATNDARTQAASDRQSTREFIASFTPIVPNELTTYPDKHFGEDVVVHGRVLTVDSSGLGALQVTLSNGQTIVVQLAPIAVLDGIYVGDTVTVYGTVDGVFTGQNGFGATFSQIKLSLGFVTKP